MLVNLDSSASKPSPTGTTPVSSDRAFASSLQKAISPLTLNGDRIDNLVTKRDMSFILSLPKIVLNWICWITSKPFEHLVNHTVDDPETLVKLPPTTLAAIDPRSFAHLNERLSELDTDQLDALNSASLPYISTESLEKMSQPQAQYLLDHKASLMTNEQIDALEDVLYPEMRKRIDSDPELIEFKRTTMAKTPEELLKDYQDNCWHYSVEKLHIIKKAFYQIPEDKFKNYLKHKTMRMETKQEMLDHITAIPLNRIETASFRLPDLIKLLNNNTFRLLSPPQVRDLSFSLFSRLEPYHMQALRPQLGNLTKGQLGELSKNKRSYKELLKR